MSKIALITGARGFLGSHLVTFLISKNIEVFNLGDRKAKNCKHIYLNNITDKKEIIKVISKLKPDYLFHLAGSSNTSSDINECFSVNTIYAQFLLEAIEAAELEMHTKIIMIGSAAEYGPIKSNQLPIKEDLSPKPTTLYGISKNAQTQIALSWQEPKRPLVIVRPFNIIGPSMPKHLAIGSFSEQIKAISNNGSIKTGNLNTERDFIDVNDVSQLMWVLVNNKNSYGEVINLCSGNPIPLMKIVKHMIKISDKKIKIISEQKRLRKNDVKIHFGDNSKLLELVGKYDFISWQKTIKSILEN